MGRAFVLTRTPLPSHFQQEVLGQAYPLSALWVHSHPHTPSPLHLPLAFCLEASKIPDLGLGFGGNSSCRSEADVTGSSSTDQGFVDDIGAKPLATVKTHSHTHKTTTTNQQTNIGFPSALCILFKNHCHCFQFSPIHLPWSDGTGCHDLSFLNVEL